MVFDLKADRYVMSPDRQLSGGRSSEKPDHSQLTFQRSVTPMLRSIQKNRVFPCSAFQNFSTSRPAQEELPRALAQGSSGRAGRDHYRVGLPFAEGRLGCQPPGSLLRRVRQEVSVGHRTFFDFMRVGLFLGGFGKGLQEIFG